MHGFSRRRWLLTLGLLLLLAVNTAAASAPAPSIQLIDLGELRAGLAGTHTGALSQLAAPATPIRVPAGTTLALEASAEAVFFQGTGTADFGLTLEDAGGRLLDYDDWSAAGTGPQREPGYLRVETTLDTPGQVELVLQSYANARLGGRQALDRQEISLTVQVLDSTAALSPAMPVVQTRAEPASLTKDDPVAQQTNVLATPRVHVFGAVAAAEVFATTEMPALSVLQGQRTRVEIRPEVVWFRALSPAIHPGTLSVNEARVLGRYAGAERAGVNSELKLFLIDSEGARVPYGEASAAFAEDGPGIAGRPLWVNLMLNDPGEFDLVARVSTSGGPNGAATQVEVPFRLVVEEAPAGQRAYIAGRVTDAETGAPIANVPVRARRADGTGPTSRIAHTDAHGRYVVEVLYGGDFIVQFGPALRVGYPERYYPSAETPEAAEAVRVAAGRTVKGINLAYEPLGSIAGRVIAEETGEPVAWPFVYVGLAGNPQTVELTRGFEDGTYVVGPLAPGQYWVGVGSTATLEGEYYRDASSISEAQLVTVEARRQTTGIDFAMAPRLTGEETGSIAGRVTAELQPGETEPSPLAGMRVVALGQGIPDWGDADTGPDGSYRIDNLPPGSYKVYARDPQRLGITEFYNHVLDVQEATPVAVRPGETTSDIDFSLPPRPTGPTGAIAGRVMVADQAGVVRKPLETLTVWAEGPSESVNPSGRSWRRYGLTDSSGNYRIELLEPGTYLLHVVDGPGLFATQYFDHVSTPEEATPVIVTGEQTTSGIDFDLLIDTDAPVLGSISGRITAEPQPGETQSVPLEGIVVEAFEQYGHRLTHWTVTGADGSYRLDHLLFGPYHVRARDPNGQYIAEYYSEWYDSVTTPNLASDVRVARGGMTTGIDLALQPVSP